MPWALANPGDESYRYPWLLHSSIFATNGHLIPLSTSIQQLGALEKRQHHQHFGSPPSHPLQPTKLPVTENSASPGATGSAINGAVESR